jgi:RNA-directed DNA polymerase
MHQHLIIQKAKQLGTLKNALELGVLLKIHPTTIALCCLQPHYKIYTIPKKNGKLRTIEDPEKKLKKIQSQLNDYLQAWYYTVKNNHVHGFCISSNTEEPKGILSNATAHLGKAYLLNIDMQDFFHQISANTVYDNLKNIMPKADDATLKNLTTLTTFKGRLPMGAPTSPVLSNICSKALDDELIAVCHKLGITYTRFADDMSFSATLPIAKLEQEIIIAAIQQQGFDINHSKTKLYNTNDTKMVTGLVLKNDKVTLPTHYIQQLHVEIDRYKTIQEVEYRYRTGMSNKKLKLFEQEITGKINFAEIILGNTDETIQQLNETWYGITSHVQDFESASWLEIPYNFY